MEQVSLTLKAKKRSYNIVIGHHILTSLGKAMDDLHLGQDAVVITNSGIKRLHGTILEKGLVKSGRRVRFFTVPEGEKSKSAEVAFNLVEKIARYAADKKIVVIAFGGGVIGDLAGFVAASYKRGVPLIQVPTTLLAQVDSSIGGKVGVDLPCGKNLMGAFYQPVLVWMDVSVLSTLSQRQIRNGLAEVIKYGVIADAALFRFIEDNVTTILARKPQVLTHLVSTCAGIKAKIVMQDELDVTGRRAILNYGHTVGHAIEAAVDYHFYQHGEAIALGMCVAGDIAYQLNMLKIVSKQRIEELIGAVGLPKKIHKVSLSQILKTMRHDKKFVAGKNRFVLASGIGRVCLVDNIDEDMIKKAIKAFF